MKLGERCQFQRLSSFANILVWKTLYEAGGRYYVDAVRVRIAPKVFAGASVAKLNLRRDVAQTDHAHFRTHRQNVGERMGRLWEMMAGWWG